MSPLTYLVALAALGASVAGVLALVWHVLTLPSGAPW